MPRRLPTTSPSASTANSLRGGQETLAVPWRLRVDRSTRISCSRSLPTSKSTGRQRLKRCAMFDFHFPRHQERANLHVGRRLRLGGRATLAARLNSCSQPSAELFVLL